MTPDLDAPSGTGHTTAGRLWQTSCVPTLHNFNAVLFQAKANQLSLHPPRHKEVCWTHVQRIE
jgi:hypothetical protein